jgi:hypothetical protein
MIQPQAHSARCSVTGQHKRLNRTVLPKNGGAAWEETGLQVVYQVELFQQKRRRMVELFWRISPAALGWQVG